MRSYSLAAIVLAIAVTCILPPGRLTAQVGEPVPISPLPQIPVLPPTVPTPVLPTPQPAQPAQDAPPAQSPVVTNRVDGLKLPDDQTVDPSEMFVVLTADVPDGASVRWIVVGTVPVKFTTSGKSIIVATPAGAAIHVYAYASSNGKVTDPARTVITVSGTAPVTPTQPAPTPPTPAPPTPAPPPGQQAANTGKLFVVLIEDPAARGRYPYLADIINNAALRRGIEQAGHRFTVLDVRDPEVTRAKLSAPIQNAGGTPALIIMDAGGNVLAAVTVPKTPEGVVDAVNVAAAKGAK